MIKHLILLKIQNMMDVNEVLLQILQKFSGGAVTPADKSAIKSKITPNQQLVEKSHQPINGKFEKQKVYSSFEDNIWGADLADMQLISKYDEVFLFSVCIIDIHSKYVYL